MKTRKPLLLVATTLASIAAVLLLSATALGKPMHYPAGALPDAGPAGVIWTLVGMAVIAGLLILSDRLWRRMRRS